MTTAEISATQEVLWNPSYYSARYYNPSTGRFLSRDPQDGVLTDPATLHKYMYAGSDPVNAMDPTGNEAMLEYGLMTKAILGPDVTVTQYDQYTGQTKVTSGPATIVGLKILGCAVEAILAGTKLAVGGQVPQIDTVECTATASNNWTMTLVQKMLDKIADKGIPGSPWKPVSGLINCSQGYVSDVSQELNNAVNHDGPNPNASANMASCMGGVTNGMTNPF